jgi:hypothetical protein
MRYLLPDDVAWQAAALAVENPGRITVEPLGEGELSRHLLVLRLGEGPLHLAVKANAHPDEPTGTVSCFEFARALLARADRDPWWSVFTVHLLPTANPRGLERNRGWLGSTSPRMDDWFLHVHRDAPHEDREFGYGATPADAAHPECAAWHAYLDALPSLAAYVSLHSMAFSGGALFLSMIQDERYQPLLKELVTMVGKARWPLHDEDRGGRKGFHYLGRGLWTAPTRDEMVAFLTRGGGPDAGQWLRLNSMQVARARHGTPICLVSELPQWWAIELGDPTPTRRSRTEVDEETAEKLQRSAEELAAIAGTSDEVRHRLATARGLSAAAGDWGERSATQGDHWRGVQTVMRAEVANAAAALRLDRERGLSYDAAAVKRFLERLARYQQRFTWCWKPLKDHAAMHMGMLDYLMAHLARER